MVLRRLQVSEYFRRYAKFLRQSFFQLRRQSMRLANRHRLREQQVHLDDLSISSGTVYEEVMERVNTDPHFVSLLAPIEGARRKRVAADEEIAEISEMFQLLAKAEEDPRAAATLVNQLLRGAVCQMFDPIRSAVRAHRTGMTQQQITEWDCANFAHEYAKYCGSAVPIALRIMTESGEIKEFTNKDGQKVYRIKQCRKQRTSFPNKRSQKAKEQPSTSLRLVLPDSR